MENRLTKILIIFLGVLVAASAQSLDVVNITLVDGLTSGQAAYKQINLSASSVSRIQLENVPENFTFIIVQAHAHEEVVVLSYELERKNGSESVGRNVGLVVRRPNLGTWIRNENNRSVSVLVAVIYYTSEGPIPGGCNMEFEVKESPYLKVLLSNGRVEVDAQPASVDKLNCGHNQVTYDAYRLYTAEDDFSKESYFTAIKSMMTVKDILENGIKVPAAALDTQMRRIYSAYPGIGSAYAMIAHYGNHSAAYVTTFSYACDPFSNPDSCYSLGDSFSKFVCGAIMLMGLLFLFVGGTIPPLEAFLWGTSTGGFIAYALTVSIGWSVTIGLFVGSISLILMALGSPCIPRLQGGLFSSAFIMGIVYYLTPDGVFETNRQFFIIYFAMTLIILISFYIISGYSNIFLTTLVGGYMTIMPLDYWFESTLKFIMINFMRRLTDDDFKVVRVNPPFQTCDAILVIVWAILVIWGAKVQAKNMGFVTTVTSSEGFPILSEWRGNRRVMVLGGNDRVSRSFY